MVKKRIIIAILCLALSLTTLFSTTTFAATSDYTGGLLDGKNMNYGASTTNVIGTSQAWTDGNLAYNSFVSGQSAYRYVWYKLSADNTVNAYYIKTDFPSRFTIGLYSSAGTLLKSIANPVSGVKTKITAVTGVRTVAMIGNLGIADTYVGEFNVFSPPDPPTGLKADGGTGGKAILSWDASSVPNLVGYNIYQDGVKLNASPITSTSYALTGLIDSRTYKLQVSTVDGFSESELSAINFIYDSTPPGKPSGLLAAMSVNQVSFSWIPNPSNDPASGYNLYQNGVKLNTSPISGTNYTIPASGLIEGLSYQYTLTALDDFGNESAPSDPVNLLITDLVPPDKPGGLEGEGQDGSVLLSWSASTEPDLKGYKIYKNGTFLLNTGKITSTIITGLTNGITYQFGLAAYDLSGNVSTKVYVNVTPQDQTAPDAPLNLSGAAGNKVLNLFWSANTETDFKGYRIYVNGSPLGGLVTSIYKSITGLQNGKSYTVEITAVDKAGNESARSNQLILTPSVTADTTPPGTPTDLMATLNKTTITASWTPRSELDLLGYFVYLNGVKANYAPLSSYTYNMANLKQGATYEVQVTSIDNSGNESPLSAPITITIPVVFVPTGFKAKQEDGQIVLSWNQTEPAAEHFTIFRNGQQIANVTGTSWVDNDVELEQTYRYEILAVAADGLKSERASANIYYSLKGPSTDLNDINLPFSVGGMLSTSVEFLKKYAGWIALVLGVIFGPVLIGIVMGLRDRYRGKQKVISLDGNTYTRKELEDADRAFREKFGSKYDQKSKTQKTKASKIAKEAKPAKAEVAKVAKAAAAPRAKQSKAGLIKQQIPAERNGKKYMMTTYVKPENYKQGGVVDLRSRKR